MKSTCCIPSGWEVVWHSGSSQQLAIHAGYQLSWQGIEKEAWNQANQSGAMGDLTALQIIFSKVVSEAGNLSKIARFFVPSDDPASTGHRSFTLTSTSTFVNWADALVKRNDALTWRIHALKPQKIVTPTWPCTPYEAGIPLTLFATMPGACRFLASASVIRQWRGIRQNVRAAKVMHGKTSPITHNGEGVFRGLANPLTVIFYHSLVVDPTITCVLST